MKELTWGNLIPVILGGLLSILGGAAATWLNYRHNSRLSQKQQRKRVNAVLRGIRSELSVLMAYYQEKAGQHLDKVEAGKIFAVYQIVEERCFIVYPSNTEAVGHIDDPKLSEAIITTYNKAQLLLDALRVNNWGIDRVERFRQFVRESNGAPGMVQDMNKAEAMLINWVSHLKERDTDFKSHAGRLMPMIEKYIAEHAD